MRNNCLTNDQVTYFFYLNEVLNFSQSIWILSIFFTFMKIPFLKKIEAVQLLFQLPEKILCVIWNLVTKTYPIFITFRSFLEIFKHFFKNVKKNWKYSHGFWKINKFIWNEKRIAHLIIFKRINFLAIF